MRRVAGGATFDGVDERTSQALDRHRHQAEEMVGLLGGLRAVVADAGLGGDLPGLLAGLVDRFVLDEQRLDVVATELAARAAGLGVDAA